eukprot:COSAG06_NODE_1472_length_9346_cov_5.895750_10_plen_197_part_00
MFVDIAFSGAAGALATIHGHRCEAAPAPAVLLTRSCLLFLVALLRSLYSCGWQPSTTTRCSKEEKEKEMQTPPQKMERGRRQQQQRLMSCRSARGKSSTRKLCTGAGHELTSPVYGCSFVIKWSRGVGASPDSTKCCSIYLTLCFAGFSVRRSNTSRQSQRARRSEAQWPPSIQFPPVTDAKARLVGCVWSCSRRL